MIDAMTITVFAGGLVACWIVLGILRGVPTLGMVPIQILLAILGFVLAIAADVGLAAAGIAPVNNQVIVGLGGLLAAIIWFIGFSMMSPPTPPPVQAKATKQAT